MSSVYSSSYPNASGIYYGSAPQKDLKDALRPLLEKLKHYDYMRTILEKQDTDRYFWQKMTYILSEKIELHSDWGQSDVALLDPEAVKKAVRSIHYDLHLEIRQRNTLLPVYYLCRTQWDYWSEYGLIVEDLYASPGYPFQDERLVRLMQAGHEIYYLRLSHLRNGTAAMLKGNASDSSMSRRTDQLLYQIGRYVFQAIWHEDQKPALAACSAFGLVRFGRAMELLYLCLSGDLCNLRGVLTEEFFQFFTAVYPQPALESLLHMIQEADGATLADLPQRARPLYFRLSKAFGAFLKQEVPWRKGRNPLPLFKILFANLSRLELLPAMLNEISLVQAAVAKLEQESDLFWGYRLMFRNLKSPIQ